MHAVTEDEQPRGTAGMRRHLRLPRSDPLRHGVDQLEQPRVARYPIVVREPQPVDAMLPVLGAGSQAAPIASAHHARHRFSDRRNSSAPQLPVLPALPPGRAPALHLSRVLADKTA
jgi:hypothetical protein